MDITKYARGLWRLLLAVHTDADPRQLLELMFQTGRNDARKD